MRRQSGLLCRCRACPGASAGAGAALPRRDASPVPPPPWSPPPGWSAQVAPPSPGGRRVLEGTARAAMAAERRQPAAPQSNSRGGGAAAVGLQTRRARARASATPPRARRRERKGQGAGAGEEGDVRTRRRRAPGGWSHSLATSAGTSAAGGLRRRDERAGSRRAAETSQRGLAGGHHASRLGQGRRARCVAPPFGGPPPSADGWTGPPRRPAGPAAGNNVRETIAGRGLAEGPSHTG